SPTTLNTGAAATTSASTHTGWPCSPVSASLATRASTVIPPPGAALAGAPSQSSVERERGGQVTHHRRPHGAVHGHDVEAHVADAAQRPRTRRQPQLGEPGDLPALACVDSVLGGAAGD